MRADLVRLRDEHDRPCRCARDSRTPSRDRSGVIGVVEQLLQRHDRCLIEAPRSIAASRVVGADRLDRVADELEPDGSRGAGRIEVDDAAADAELAVLVDRILARVAGLGEQIAEVDRRDVVPGRKRRATASQQPIGRRSAAAAAPPPTRRRAAPSPTRCACSARARADASRSAAPARDTDRPRATGTAARRARLPCPTGLRALRRRTARRGSRFRRPRPSEQPGAPDGVRPRPPQTAPSPGRQPGTRGTGTPSRRRLAADFSRPEASASWTCMTAR